MNKKYFYYAQLLQNKGDKLNWIDVFCRKNKKVLQNFLFILTNFVVWCIIMIGNNTAR